MHVFLHSFVCGRECECAKAKSAVCKVNERKVGAISPDNGSLDIRVAISVILQSLKEKNAMSFIDEK